MYFFICVFPSIFFRHYFWHWNFFFFFGAEPDIIFFINFKIDDIIVLLHRMHFILLNIIYSIIILHGIFKKKKNCSDPCGFLSRSVQNPRITSNRRAYHATSEISLSALNILQPVMTPDNLRCLHTFWEGHDARSDQWIVWWLGVEPRRDIGLLNPVRQRLQQHFLCEKMVCYSIWRLTPIASAPAYDLTAPSATGPGFLCWQACGLTNTVTGVGRKRRISVFLRCRYQIFFVRFKKNRNPKPFFFFPCQFQN